VLQKVDGELAGEGVTTSNRPDAGAPAPEDTRAHVIGLEQWPGKESARVVVTLDRKVPFRAGDE
jgi:hypothetical protein